MHIAARTRAIAALALFAGLSACQVGPDYDAPEATTPEQWHALSQAAPLEFGEMPDPEWWATLGDPALTALLHRAVEANPDIAGASARLRRARHLVGAAEARLLPQLGATTRFDRVSISESFPVLDRFFAAGQADPDQQLASATFDAAWELDIFGGSRRRVEAAAARAEAADDARRAVLLSVVAEVARNYFDLRRAQADVGHLEESIDLQARRVALAGARLDAGVGALPALEEARGREDSLAARLPPLLAQEAAAAYRLAVLTARPPAEVHRELAGPAPLPEPPDLVPVGLPAEVLRRRPDIRRAERELAAATATIGVDVSRLFPRISLTGLAGFQAQGFTDLFESGNSTWAIGPGVRWDVLRGGALRARVAASRAARDGRLAAWEATVNEAIADVEGALTRYGRAFESREHLGAAVAHSEQAVSLARRAMDAGVVSEEAVLEAQLRRAEALRALNGARAEVLVNLASLNKALGGGWPVPADTTP